MPTLEELEQRREQKLAERKKKEEQQLVIDMEARDPLEDELGPVAAIQISPFVDGYPARAFVRAPTEVEYKRYTAQVGRNHEKKSTSGIRDAQDLLAKSCWVYPTTPDERKRMLERFPGLLTTIGIAAARLGEGKQEDEGKD